VRWRKPPRFSRRRGNISRFQGLRFHQQILKTGRRTPFGVFPPHPVIFFPTPPPPARASSTGLGRFRRGYPEVAEVGIPCLARGPRVRPSFAELEAAKGDGPPGGGAPPAAHPHPPTHGGFVFPAPSNARVCRLVWWFCVVVSLVTVGAFCVLLVPPFPPPTSLPSGSSVLTHLLAQIPPRFGSPSSRGGGGYYARPSRRPSEPAPSTVSIWRFFVPPPSPVGPTTKFRIPFLFFFFFPSLSLTPEAGPLVFPSPLLPPPQKKNKTPKTSCPAPGCLSPLFHQKNLSRRPPTLCFLPFSPSPADPAPPIFFLFVFVRDKPGRLPPRLPDPRHGPFPPPPPPSPPRFRVFGGGGVGGGLVWGGCGFLVFFVGGVFFFFFFFESPPSFFFLVVGGVGGGVCSGIASLGCFCSKVGFGPAGAKVVWRAGFFVVCFFFLWFAPHPFFFFPGNLAPIRRKEKPLPPQALLLHLSPPPTPPPPPPPPCLDPMNPNPPRFFCFRQKNHLPGGCRSTPFFLLGTPPLPPCSFTPCVNNGFFFFFLFFFTPPPPPHVSAVPPIFPLAGPGWAPPPNGPNGLCLSPFFLLFPPPPLWGPPERNNPKKGGKENWERTPPPLSS